MKKIVTCSVALGVLLWVSSARAGAPSLTASSAVILSPKGVVLWEKNPGYRCPPASTTKVMTALVVIDRLPLDRWISVSRNAEQTEPTRAGIRRGEAYRVRDLLYALLMKSGNDVAVCLAEGVSGSESRFAQLMNARTRRLGAAKTTFKRASGLPASGQVTTARDLAMIMIAGLKSSLIKDALKTRTKTIRAKCGREISLRNHNRLLWDRSHNVILKTGYTRASRHCYVGYIGPDGRDGVFAFVRARKPWPDARALSVFARAGGAKVYFNRLHLCAGTVRAVQSTLAKKGFNPGPVDGVFGRKTLAALENFQKKTGLSRDGLIGSQTLSRLGLRR